jgi:hypothetical protein
LLLEREYAVLGNCHTPRGHIRSKRGSLKWRPDDHRLSQCHCSGDFVRRRLEDRRALVSVVLARKAAHPSPRV